MIQYYTSCFCWWHIMLWEATLLKTHPLQSKFRNHQDQNPRCQDLQSIKNIWHDMDRSTITYRSRSTICKYHYPYHSIYSDLSTSFPIFPADIFTQLLHGKIHHVPPFVDGKTHEMSTGAFSIAMLVITLRSSNMAGRYTIWFGDFPIESPISRVDGQMMWFLSQFEQGQYDQAANIVVAVHSFGFVWTCSVTPLVKMASAMDHQL